MLTVAQLIRQLSSLPPDAEVAIEPTSRSWGAESLGVHYDAVGDVPRAYVQFWEPPAPPARSYWNRVHDFWHDPFLPARWWEYPLALVWALRKEH